MLLSLLLAGLASAPPTLPARAQAEVPISFVVLVVDDLSWEEFFVQPLPVLQAVAPAARIYDRFYSSAVCSPSRYQLQFGRYPHRAGIGLVLDGQTDAGVSTGEVSIAETLAHHGFKTALFGKWHVNGEALPGAPEEFPRLHGYQRWLAGSVGSIPGSGSHYGWTRYDDGVESFETTYSTHAIGNEFVNWWVNTKGSKLAVINLLAPHAPFELAPANLLGGATFEGPGLRDEYESAVRAIDTKFAQMASVIDFSRTYVFLVADNGTPASVPPPNRMEQGYKLTHFEGGVNVPLLVWGPTVLPGVDSSLVQMVDLPRTLLDLVDADGPGMEDSISFADTLTGGEGQRQHAFVHRFSPNGDTDVLFGESWALVRDDGWKLVAESVDLALGVPPVLYNVVTNPHEVFSFEDPVITSELLDARAAILGPDWPNPY